MMMVTIIRCAIHVKVLVINVLIRQCVQLVIILNYDYLTILLTMPIMQIHIAAVFINIMDRLINLQYAYHAIIHVQYVVMVLLLIVYFVQLMLIEY